MWSFCELVIPSGIWTRLIVLANHCFIANSPSPSHSWLWYNMSFYLGTSLIQTNWRTKISTPSLGPCYRCQGRAPSSPHCLVWCPRLAQAAGILPGPFTRPSARSRRRQKLSTRTNFWQEPFLKSRKMLRKWFIWPTRKKDSGHRRRFMDTNEIDNFVELWYLHIKLLRLIRNKCA